MTGHRDESFEAFVDAYGSRLLRSALLQVGDRRDAEDLVQVALEKTYRHWDRVRQAESPQAYVRQILTNSATNEWRRRRRSARVPLTAVSENSLHLVSADDQGHMVDLRDTLLRALAELPAGQRAVLILRYFWDLTEAETAEALGCSAGTVKSRASRALARMRRFPNLVKPTVRSST